MTTTIDRAEEIAHSHTEGRRFDAALRSAQGWRRDAQTYLGARRDVRLRHAERMEQIAARIVERV